MRSRRVALFQVLLAAGVLAYGLWVYDRGRCVEVSGRRPSGVYYHGIACGPDRDARIRVMVSGERRP
jgi:hypothetical protein